MQKDIKNSNSFSIGQASESAVEAFYQQRGALVIAKNYFNRKGKRFGEIDLIALKGRSIYFIEVKARSSEMFGGALASFTAQKRAKLIKTIEYFLLLNPQYRALQPKIHLAIVAINPVDKTAQSIKILIDVID